MAALFASSATASGDAPVVREERTVEVNGTAEVWRLEWVHPPAPVCRPDDERWFTCPCRGFEFGEEGELDLIRLRPGTRVDRLHLTSLFSAESTSEVPQPAQAKHHAALRRWPVVDEDRKDWRVDPASVMKRAPLSVVEIGDFNRDGWATEFVLQIGAIPCGKRASVLVELSPPRPSLSVFSSAEHPERPLILYVHQWEKLRTAKAALRVVSWTCGDHGSEVQNEIVLTIDAKGIHAVRETFSCVDDAEHGPLIARENL